MDPSFPFLVLPHQTLAEKGGEGRDTYFLVPRLRRRTEREDARLVPILFFSLGGERMQGRKARGARREARGVPPFLQSVANACPPEAARSSAGATRSLRGERKGLSDERSEEAMRYPRSGRKKRAPGRDNLKGEHTGSLMSIED